MKRRPRAMHPSRFLNDHENIVPTVAFSRAPRYAEVFRVLGDPTRLEILLLLAAAAKAVCVCELREHFKLSQGTVSHHLSILRKSGLVKTEKRGTWVWYDLNRREIRSVLEAFRLDVRR